MFEAPPGAFLFWRHKKATPEIQEWPLTLKYEIKSTLTHSLLTYKLTDQ
jgi:hypothetical protein